MLSIKILGLTSLGSYWKEANVDDIMHCIVLLVPQLLNVSKVSGSLHAFQ